MHVFKKSFYPTEDEWKEGARHQSPAYQDHDSGYKDGQSSGSQTESFCLHKPYNPKPGLYET